jgi:hypothetical protein
MGAQSKSGFVPKNYKNNEEKLKILEKWVFGFLWGKRGNGGGGGRGNGRERPAVLGGGSDGWRWCVVGLDFRERTEKGRGEGCTAATGKWVGIGKNDLKIGPVKAQLECVRTYIRAFDRTRA